MTFLRLAFLIEHLWWLLLDTWIYLGKPFFVPTSFNWPYLLWETPMWKFENTHCSRFPFSTKYFTKKTWRVVFVVITCAPRVNSRPKLCPTFGRCPGWFIFFKSLFYQKQGTLLKKGSFPLRISSVNVTKSVGTRGFGHIYWKFLNGKLHFLCSSKYVMGIVVTQIRCALS